MSRATIDRLVTISPCAPDDHHRRCIEVKGVAGRGATPD